MGLLRPTYVCLQLDRAGILNHLNCDFNAKVKKNAKFGIYLNGPF
jgi:hypothetical protein